MCYEDRQYELWVLKAIGCATMTTHHVLGIRVANYLTELPGLVILVFQGLSLGV